MSEERIGEQELLLLRELTEGGPASVGEMAERFGAPRGLARSTVLTMMERLRHKGYLSRRLHEGVFRYQARKGARELLAALVRRFVEGSLGGSLSPFTAYLAERREVSPAELEELERAVERLRARRGGERP